MQNTDSNSPNSPNQPADTADNSDIVSRARGNRRIDATTISEIARLCAKQLTESEACRRLGVRPRHWFDWKTRHSRSEKFAELLEAFRADRIDSLISKIEKSADGIGLKQPDWRAAAALLKFADMKRFGDSPAVEINNAFAPLLTDAQIAKVEALFLKSKAIASAPAPKQIQAAEIVPERVAKNE
jgi:hypothetical protein